MTDPTHICCGSGFPLPNTTSPTLIGTLAFPSVLDGSAYYYDASGIFSGTATRYRIVTGEMGSGITFDETTCIFSGTASGTTDLEGISIAAEDTESLSETSNTDTLVIGTTLTIPIWIEPITFTWVVGDYVYEPIANLIENPDPDDEYLDLLTFPWPVGVSVVDGIIVGTVAELQGGTYTPELSAENALGISYTQVSSEVLVALPPETPVLATPADIATGLLEEGSSYQFTLTSTNPEQNTLFYELSPNQVVFDAITVSSAGVVSFLIAAGQDTGSPWTVTYKVTDTVTALSSTASHSVTIDAVTGTVETPQLGWFGSGVLYCSTVAVEPTWTDGPYAAFVITDSDATAKSIDIESLYILSNGGAAISGFALAGGSDALPANWSLHATTGFLTRTATTNTVGESLTNILIVATNSAGDSLDSPAFSLTFWDDTVIVPVLTTIDAEAGTNYVFANFDIAVKAASETAAAYILGCTVEVNPVTPAVTRTITSASNFSSNRIRYTIGGVAFSSEQTVRFSYDKTLGGLVSVDNSVAVETTVAPDFQIPIVHEGVIYQTGFEQSEGIDLGPLPTSTQTNNFSWTSATSVYVDDGRAKTGSQSLLFPFLSSRKEKRMNIGGSYKELWFSYDIYIPSNYYHDNVSGTDNNKFFAIWGGGQAGYAGQYRSGPLLVFELHLLGGQPDTDFMKLLLGTRVDNVVTYSGYFNVSSNPGEDGSGLLIRSTDKGHWMKITMHMKYATKADWVSRTGGDPDASYTRGDGIVELWKTSWTGGVDKVIDLNIVPMYANNSLTFEEAEGFDSAYLWGANNAEFAETTNVYVDNFVVSASPLNGFTGY